MLQIQLNFYRGVCVAASSMPRVDPEFPAHPLRLYAALISAAYGGGRSEMLPVLRQLEGFGPPTILTGVPVETTENTIEHYVHTAPKPDRFNQEYDFTASGKMPLRRPRTRLNDPRQIYTWDAQPSAELLDVLDALLPDVTYIGSNDSLVEARRIVPDEHGVVRADWTGLTERYLPDALHGDLRIRTIHPGLMASFDEAHQRGSHLNIHPVTRYRCISQSRSEGVETPWKLAFRFRLRGDDIPLEAALPLSEAFRGTLLSLDREGTSMPSVLHGHQHKGPHHVAFMPLPFVGTPHADGLIKGIGVAVPRSVGGDERALVSSFMYRMDGATVCFHGMTATLERMGYDERGLVSLRHGTWTRASRTWVSVTPIALDDWPGNDAEGVVAKACVRAGLPVPERVEFVRVSLAGSEVPHSRRFQGILRRCAKGTPAVWGHARIRWREPVKGPLLLGRLRHFGIGLFMPESQRDGG